MSPVFTSASGPPAADSGATCSTTVPYAVPLMRASEMRTMSVMPLRRIFGGSAMLPTSAMPGITLRAAALEHHDAVLVDVETLVVDLRLEVFDGLEHHRGPAMLE